MTFLQLNAQQFRMVAILKDSESGKGISNAYVTSSLGQAISNQEGIFSVLTQANDTVVVSHVGYKMLALAAINGSDTILLKMQPETVHLKEVTVLDFFTEEGLREKILVTEVIETDQERNARENMEKARTLFRMGYRAPMSDLEKFQYYMKPPEGVTFFSSKGGGLISALKKLASSPPVISYPTFTRNSRPAGLYFKSRHHVAADTLKYDSLLVQADTLDHR